MRKTGRQEKRFSEQVLSCFLAFLMNPSGPLRLCVFAFQMPFGCISTALGFAWFALAKCIPLSGLRSLLSGLRLTHSPIHPFTLSSARHPNG